MTIVCEVGPAAVRLLRPGTRETPDGPNLFGRLVDAVLDAPGEPLALVEDRPVRADVIWRSVFERVLGDAHTVVLVHPSWWVPRWVDGVATAARQVAANVMTLSRSGLLHRGTAFVEIGPDLVVVGDRRGRVTAESRLAAADRVADGVAARIDAGGLVHIDAPFDVPGAEDLGSLVAQRLRASGTTVRHLDDRHLYAAAVPSSVPCSAAESPTAQPRWRGVHAAAGLGAVIAVAAAAGIGVGTAPPRRPAAGRETLLVEGRIAVRVPADWPVQRVTTGPGSARIQVVSPVDPEAILHITQSPVPTPDLAATANALRLAVDAQPPGVFVDFHPGDRRAGRPVVSYREVRPGHDIRWAVVVAGGVRISIGCQSGPGGDHHVAHACEQAILSASEIG